VHLSQSSLKTHLSATLLASAIVAGVLAIGGCATRSSADCTRLVGVEVGSRLTELKSYLVVINATDATCMIRTPSISLATRSGAVADLRQNWISGASEGLQTGPRQAVAVPFLITPRECSEVVQFDCLTATFGGGVKARIETTMVQCPGGRIKVWTPIPVQRCMDGFIIWPWPTTDGSRPTCEGPRP
jgi:hypothetical protein